MPVCICAIPCHSGLTPSNPQCDGPYSHECGHGTYWQQYECDGDDYYCVTSTVCVYSECDCGLSAHVVLRRTDMDESLIEGLGQRETQILERQQYLEQYIKEYRELTEERQLISALLNRYKTPSDSLASPSPNISSSLLPSPQEIMTGESTKNAQTPNTQITTKIKTRQSPGEAEKHVDYILSRGENHSIVSLLRRIQEVLGIVHSDSTIGVVLRRGERHGKYKRDGSIWSMVLDQNQPTTTPRNLGES
jgi:hypothetical protein